MLFSWLIKYFAVIQAPKEFQTPLPMKTALSKLHPIAESTPVFLKPEAKAPNRIIDLNQTFSAPSSRAGTIDPNQSKEVLEPENKSSIPSETDSAYHDQTGKRQPTMESSVDPKDSTASQDTLRQDKDTDNATKQVQVNDKLQFKI